MKILFTFFLRVFFCFVAAKFLLRVLDLDHRAYLTGLTALLIVNLYWFDFLEYRSRIAFHLRRVLKPAPQPDAKPEEASAPQIPTDV